MATQPATSAKKDPPIAPPWEQEVFINTVNATKTEAELKAIAEQIIEKINWAKKEKEIRTLFKQLMLLSIPERWKDMADEIFNYISWQVSQEWLKKRLLEQLMLPIDTSQEDRFLQIVLRMSSLQAIAQTIISENLLDEEFRRLLIRWELKCHDMVRTEVKRQLGPQLKKYDVKLYKVSLVDTCVNPMVYFSWNNFSIGKREAGVMEVLMHYEPEHHHEAKTILTRLQHEKEHFSTLLHLFDLPESETLLYRILDVTLTKLDYLLEHEIDPLVQQQVLGDVYERLANIKGIRMGQLIPEFCTDTIITISKEEGLRLAQAFPDDPRKRWQLAFRIASELIMRPLFTQDDQGLFLGDPNEENLVFNQKTEDLIICNWSHQVYLDLETRHNIILLVLTLIWHDGRWASEVIESLIDIPKLENMYSLRKNAPIKDVIRGYTTQFISELPLKRMPTLSDAINLLQGLNMYMGQTTTSDLMKFARIVDRLELVLIKMGAKDVLALSFLAKLISELIRNVPGRFTQLPFARSNFFHGGLSNYDIARLYLSFPLVGNRLILSLSEQIFKSGLTQLIKLANTRDDDIPNGSN